MQLPDNAAIDVVLEGGPDGISPASVLGGRSLAAQDRLKIPHQGGYEHFERLGTPVSATPTVFRWVARTKIAE
jgi:hypothetical protein